MPEQQFLVVIDPAREEQPALERAIQSCQITGAALHLFECVNENYLAALPDGTDASKEAIMAAFQSQLEQRAAQIAEQGIAVTHELDWSEDWCQAIVDAAARHNSYMVLKSSYFHTPGERNRKTADWSLLRECSCPVLLMHNNTDWHNKRVLAAINMAANDEQHLKLNKKIIDVANNFAAQFDSTVHYVNAYSPQKSTASAPDMDVFYDGFETETPAIQLSETALADYCHTDTSHVHLREGRADDAILETANEVGVDLIIVGSVRRKGIKGRVIGNTTEKLLDNTRADVLTLA